MSVEEVKGGLCGHANTFEIFFNPQQHLCCMNHISKARCKRYGADKVQEVVNAYKLNTYEGKYDYCPPVWIQPLLYGWFPFSVVNQCMKVEKLVVDWWPNS